jgi:hypothetical protein
MKTLGRFPGRSDVYALRQACVCKHFLDFYNLHPNGKTAFPNIPIISGDSQQDSHPYECC